MEQKTGKRLVLASGSPRRLALVRQLGFAPDTVFAPGIDESARQRETPPVYARRIARAKALFYDGTMRDCVILAADTVVALGRRILGKPSDRRQAEEMLRLLSGRRHRVYGAVALRSEEGISLRIVVTMVMLKRLSEEEIAFYLGSGEWRDKAGGYAIQGLAGAFVSRLNGSYSNVVGLPIFETGAMLRGAGFRPAVVPPHEFDGTCHPDR